MFESTLGLPKVRIGHWKRTVDTENELRIDAAGWVAGPVRHRQLRETLPRAAPLLPLDLLHLPRLVDPHLHTDARPPLREFASPSEKNTSGPCRGPFHTTPQPPGRLEKHPPPHATLGLAQRVREDAAAEPSRLGLCSPRGNTPNIMLIYILSKHRPTRHTRTPKLDAFKFVNFYYG